MLTFEVVASDPEGSALSFSWEANTGSLGAPAHGESHSRITWTAPSCVGAGATPTITVTNAFNLTTSLSFLVAALPACPTWDWAATGSMIEPRINHSESSSHSPAQSVQQETAHKTFG